MLKRVWKLVHPDLFSASLKQSLARAVNEESMKSLNQWVEARGGPSVPLSFFVHDGEAQLRRVDVVLGGGDVGVALRRLLEALGGEPGGQWEEEEETLCLLDWLGRHAAEARERLSRFQALDRQEALYRHALARNRVVGISFSRSLAGNKTERVRLVSQLAAMADVIQPTLAGVRVKFEDSDGATTSGSVDSLGRLVLSAGDVLDVWCKAVTEESLRQLLLIKAFNEERRQLETAAAAALKVRLVTGESETLMQSPEYSATLHSLASHQRPGLSFPEMSLLFWSDSENVLSPRRDTLYAPMLDATRIIREIDKLPIVEIQRELRVLSALDEQECQMRVFTKRRLRLAGLLRSPTVSLDQSRSCQQKLSVAGNGVVNHATGLYIRIDSCFSVDEDGTLGVAWNCRV